METDTDNSRDPEPSVLWRVVIPYAVVSSLWILLSDAMLSLRFHDDPTGIAIASTVKGWVFVAVTSGLLLILVRRYGSRLEQREAMLQESDLRFRSFVENANDVLFVLNTSGVFRYVSPQWKDAFGYELDETIGRPFPPFVHPDDVPACVAFLQRTIATGMKQSGVEYRVLCKDGTYLWYRANGAVIKDAETGELTFVGIGRDITELKRFEAELIAAKRDAEEASLVKSRFLAAASHDLRQPVQAINLFRDALSETELNEEQKRISHYLALSAKSLGDLLDALLDISKLDAGTVRSRPKAIQADELFRDIDARFSPVAAAKSLRFKLHFPQREIAILTDAKLLQSLLSNLIGNAIKYTEQGGILVGIRSRGSHVVIQVWDTGIGIAPEDMGVIFEEYFQVGNPERDSAKGLGLGLSIAKRLAKLLGTDVICHSQLGKGSVFELSLPLVEGWTDEEPCQTGI